MTKRYGFEMDKNCYKCIVDVIDKKLYTDKKQVVDLLNSLNDENEQLKSELGKVHDLIDMKIEFTKECYSASNSNIDYYRGAIEILHLLKKGVRRMTEKRFDYTNYDDGTESIYDKEKDEYYFDCEFCKLDEVLNELDEKYVDEYALRETLQLELQRVEEENEQLKKELDLFKPVIFESYGKSVTLYEKGDVE